MISFFKAITSFFLIALLFTSCVSYKNVPYFQDLGDSTDVIPALAFKPYKIQKNDLLSISITSPSPETSALFNPTSNAASATDGYLVNSEGKVTLPVIGVVSVEGATTNQATEIISKKVQEYQENATVVVKILNFKVSIAGEVARAGVYNIPNEKINLVEALSMAGDLKMTGKRENILIVRQTEGGTVYGRVDLRSKDAFKSPYFYLQNNDMVYVDPNLKRVERDENLLRNGSFVLSAITALTLVFVRLGR